MIFMPVKQTIKKDLLVPITKIIKETNDTKTFRFSLNEEQRFDFYPGQFIMVEVFMKKDWCMENANQFKDKLDTEPKDGPQKRAFSIASSPSNKEYIEITVKKEIFVSRYLVNEFEEGDNVKIGGPYGKFYYRKDMGKDLVLLAGGSGIVPLMCIMRYIKDNKLDINTTLMYSSKTPEDIIYKKELDEIDKEGKMKIIHTITRPDGYEWNGEIGRIDKEKLSKLENLANSLIYICGPPVMVDNTVSILKDELKIDKERIKIERW